MKSKLLILIIALLSTLSCKSTKMTTVFKCDDIECLKKFMGEPTKITENNNIEPSINESLTIEAISTEESINKSSRIKIENENIIGSISLKGA